jgi:hypothetical protein
MDRRRLRRRSSSDEVDVKPHEVLQVPAGADPLEVRRAFRRFALEHHPDRGGSSERFAAGRAAYRDLLDRFERPEAPVAPPNVVFHRRRRGWERLSATVRLRRPRPARRTRQPEGEQ